MATPPLFMKESFSLSLNAPLDTSPPGILQLPNFLQKGVKGVVQASKGRARVIPLG
jgi:hypothetical protein